jgi:hypothetical protein
MGYLSGYTVSPIGTGVEPPEPPTIRVALMVRFGAIGAFLLLIFLQAAGQEVGLGDLLLIAVFGFAVGVLIGRWWGLGIWVVATLIWVALAPGDGNTSDPGWYVLGLLVPGAIAFGVLGAHFRRADPRAASRAIAAGAVLLLIAALGFVIFATGYNDDEPSPAIVGWGFVAAVLLGPPGVCLCLAGFVGTFHARTTTRTADRQAQR